MTTYLLFKSCGPVSTAQSPQSVQYKRGDRPMYDHRLISGRISHPPSPLGFVASPGDRAHAAACDWLEQVQMALALANPSLLRSLLTDCTPSLIPAHRIGAISSMVGVPIEAADAADGVLQFEVIHSVLATPQSQVDEWVSGSLCSTGSQPDHRCVEREYARLTQCESELHTLGRGMTLTEAIALLSHAGFSSAAIRDILSLPFDGWHKSWWYMPDESQHFTIPFRRYLRTRRLADGTVTLQYKDFFAHTKPCCFTSQIQRVLIDVQVEPTSFTQTLRRINYRRDRLGIAAVMLVCDRVSELEARGYINQGVHLLSAAAIALPTHADCTHCANHDCPMQGNPDSPVLTCQRFCRD
ncbi:MAG: hypothetical protein VKK04_25185 [Synechococcales bacterium]|nr:hypothetical protein [Synechococcales bacterium]